MKEKPGIYIVEDDDTMIEILQDMIEDHELGVVLGSTMGHLPKAEQILAAAPDIVLVDFLMPGKDGVALVRELRALGCHAKFIMISQVSSKDMIAKAYDAGVEFFINKPINIIEVSSVIATVAKQLRNERTIAHLRSMFYPEGTQYPEGTRYPEGPQYSEDARYPEGAVARRPEASGGKQSAGGVPSRGNGFERQVAEILGKLGMAGEKGSADIIRICVMLREEGRFMSRESVRDICGELSDAPKSMEQRMRRAISVGLTNLAHLGIEDFMNDIFTEYASTLFSFEEVRAEMDYVRGKRAAGGKVSIKTFIESLMLIAERNLKNF